MTIPNANRATEQLEPSYTDSRNPKRYDCSKRQLAASKKAKHTLSIWPRNPTQDIDSKEIKTYVRAKTYM